jgi:S-adenosylmethionine hydrolase
VAERGNGGDANGAQARFPAVFFLSDYGTVDEFVGVVHAVLHRVAPTVPVIDLSHQVPAFDITAGAAMLVRAGPHLGPGVVLAVVDPGVGTDRRGVALEVPVGGPRWLVGPDNGLLLPLAASLGGVRAAFALHPVGGRSAGTFDGRDVFAPAAAHLALGGEARAIGQPMGTATLQPEPDGGPPERADLEERTQAGRVGVGGVVRAEVTWIDRFGNVQLTARPEALSAIGVTMGDTVVLTVVSTENGGEERDDRRIVARRVLAFGRLDGGEFGLLDDANGLVSLVLDRASAAQVLGLPGPGVAVEIRAEDRGADPYAGPSGS